MKLTKLQKEAIRVLKTTKRPKAIGILHEINDGVSCYCALGIIGKCVLKMKNSELDESTDAYDAIQNRLGLTKYGVNTITKLNDDLEMTFDYIGEEMENNASKFFKKGKK